MSKEKQPNNISEFILTDVDHLEGNSLYNGWIRIDTMPSFFCKDNPKTHSIDKIWQSIVSFGFIDAAKIDINLTNVEGEKGALVFGHGRNIALHYGWEQWKLGTHDTIPEGIKYDDEYWYVPVTFGIDAKSEAQALDMLLFHNSSVMLGGNFQDSDIWRMYDKGLLSKLGQIIQNDSDGAFEPLAMDAEEVNDLLRYLTSEGKEDTDTQPEPPKQSKKEVTCPDCGHIFKPE